jgi:hypothetical protein
MGQKQTWADRRTTAILQKRTSLAISQLGRLPGKELTFRVPEGARLRRAERVDAVH